MVTMNKVMTVIPTVIEVPTKIKNQMRRLNLKSPEGMMTKTVMLPIGQMTHTTINPTRGRSDVGKDVVKRN